MKENKTEEKPEDTSKEESKTKVPLSEDFQREVVDMLSKATKDECDFICDKAYERQDVLRKAEKSKDDVDMDDYEAAMSPD